MYISEKFIENTVNSYFSWRYVGTSVRKAKSVCNKYKSNPSKYNSCMVRGLSHYRRTVKSNVSKHCGKGKTPQHKRSCINVANKIISSFTNKIEKYKGR